MTSDRETLLMRTRDRLSRDWARYRERYLRAYVFIHINKTGGSSVEAALRLPFEHKTALEKEAELGPALWRRKHKFAFVRNPWDKVVSHYHYRVQTNQTGLGDASLGFGDWVRAAYRDRDPRYYDQPRMFMPQWEWISDREGRRMVDFVGRFESLSDDFATLCEHLGIRARLPHLKASKRKAYAAYYEPETRTIVGEAFEVDLEHFGYEF